MMLHPAMSWPDPPPSLFRRCVQCPPETPSCPNCSAGHICSKVVQSCDTCAYTECVVDPAAHPPAVSSNVGAIAGGIIGALALVALIVFLVWRFWIKKRRAQQDADWAADEWDRTTSLHPSDPSDTPAATSPDDDDDVARQKRFTALRPDDTASTRTRTSLATSIFSRASNIIQIAYIPGVTNRNTSTRNTLHEHPVPPLPSAYANPPPPPSPTPTTASSSAPATSATAPGPPPPPTTSPPPPPPRAPATPTTTP